MANNLSKRAIDRLGDRLAGAGVPSADDLEELAQAQAQWIPALDAALRAVTAVVAASNATGVYHVTHRKKTLSTLREKIARGTS